MSALDDLAEVMHNTAPGKVAWAKILKPDYKYDKDGMYTMDHFLEREHAEVVLGAIRPIVGMKAQHENCAQYAPPPFTIDAETGIHCFKYRQSAIGRPNKGDPFKITINVFDAQMNQWPRDVLIGNGSIVKVCYTLWPWNVAARGGVGVTLRPKAVQIINHVPYEAEERTYGFQPQEGTDMGPQPFQNTPANDSEQADIPLGEVPASSAPYENHTTGPVTPEVPF